MTTLTVTSVNSLRCQVSTCFRIGSKLRCIRSTPTEMQSMSENDFECFASTGVKTPNGAKLAFVPKDGEPDRDRERPLPCHGTGKYVSHGRQKAKKSADSEKTGKIARF